MNGGTFNLIRFSASDGRQYKTRKGSHFSAVYGSVGTGKISLRQTRFPERIGGALALFPLRKRSVTLSLEYAAALSLWRRVRRFAAFGGNTGAALFFCRLHTRALAVDFRVEHCLSFCHIVLRAAALPVRWAAYAQISRRLVRAAPHAALMNSLFSVYLLSTQLLTIDVTLHPGQELRIDSENYNVLLDGENILHLQAGEWIFLDRNTLELHVDSASGKGLSGAVVYTERYL